MEENKTSNNSACREPERQDISAKTEVKAADMEPGAAVAGLEDELNAQKDKYVRLYAEFENYKRRTLKDKEELVKYGNESLLYELLPVIDNLEMAMKHSADDVSSGLVQGVEITLKEFLRVLDRFGLVRIDALGKTFDPSLHHAMTQVERDDLDENIVAEEYRKGYLLKDKVLRPSLVAVSKKPAESGQMSVVGKDNSENNNNIEEEE